MTYGLIGETLKHSYSKEIHESLANYQYDLIPLNKEEFHTFMKNRSFTAINVTIPYKKAVIPYLDVIDDHAKQIGAVNTIVHKDDQLYGYNTDYYGFLYMIKKHHVTIEHKKVIILGSGGACNACYAVIHDLKPKELFIVGRTKKANVITYEECLEQHADIDIIINTTPVGMYPNTNASPIDLSAFKQLEYVFDVIYNPLQTTLCLQAKDLGIPYVSGLEMLVAQAKQSVEHFLDQSLSDTCIDEIYQQLYFKHCNIVLIGMPSSGKTTIGKQIALQLHKTFIDCDEEIVKEARMSIPKIFELEQEEGFRKREATVIQEVSKVNNAIISTGGGCILNKENMMQLQKNGILIYIDRDLDNLITKDENRPLSSSKEKVASLYAQRLPLYKRYADLTIENNTSIEQCISHLINVLYDTYFKKMKGRDYV